MSAPTIDLAAVPVVSWEATDDEWLFRRSKGIGGSDITAVLGFSGYNTPWETWADKTGVHSSDDFGSAAATLGTNLEPWLLDQASAVLGVPVRKSEARTYAHPVHQWRLYSPDGFIEDGRLFEAKTAGLASGFGIPSGWADDSVPLGYEFQVRWGLHIHNAPAAEVIALVAGMGLVHRTIERDLAIEADLVDQVTEWYQRHMVQGIEPALGRGDNAVILSRYHTSKGTDIDLSGTDAIELWETYRQEREREGVAKRAKEEAGAGLKALIADNARGLIDDKVLATWNPVKGKVDFERMARDLAEQAGVALPDPETYRKPSSRTLSVKD